MSSDKLSIEKLDVDNYAIWSVDMKWLLITKCCWSAISDPDNVEEETDMKALALIGLHVQKHHKSSLADCETAKEAWDLLSTVYKAKSNARRLQLRKELNNLKLAVDEPLTKYVARARGIRDQLLAAGQEIKEEEVAWSVLAGLPDNYESMVNIIEAGSEELDLDDMLPKLLIVEQRMAKQLPGTVAAYYHGSGNGPNCWKCGKKGHVHRDCPEFKAENNNKYRQVLAL